MRLKKTLSRILYPALLAGIALIVIGVVQVLAGGNIDAANKWAWSTNAGWINFNPSYGGVTVYADHLEGYAWAENIGWIRLGAYTGGGTHTYANNAAGTYGVNRDSAGNLSGYAWSTNAGWINFGPFSCSGCTAVTVDPATGSFNGYAWGENIGWIHFKNTGAAAYNVDAPPANLSIAKTVSPASAVPGQAVTYTLAFSNTGAGPAYDVVLTDAVPVTITVQSVISTGVAITDTGYTPAYKWAIQNLASGQGGIITITGHLSAAALPGTITNVATINTSAVETSAADNQKSVGLNVVKANTTTAITADTPDPSVVGQSVVVTFTVTANAPASGTPAGNVVVSDADGNSCNADVAAGKCTLALTSVGASKTLTATYAGNATFNGSFGTTTHRVDQADTTTAITADAPDPSVVGQGVVVTFTVTANAPGSGTPAGNVVVSDADGNSCAATVAAGKCTLALTSVGASKTLTATYAGNANFDSSFGTTTHRVDPADTTTAITADVPDPSLVGQGVVVTFTVTAKAPGSGTPAGNVVVSDADGNSCATTVAAGKCTLAFTSVGASKTLTATYAGNANFNGSFGTATHTVGVVSTSTSLASSGTPSIYGQSVSLTATVTAGVGTPTGNVTFYADGTSLGAFALNGSGRATTAIATLPVGTHAITATYGGAPTYGPSSASALTQRVNPATLTVTADNQSIVSGAAIPTLTYTYSGFVNNENKNTAGLSGAPNVATSATTSSPAGAYPITITQGSLAAANYTFVFVDGTLTITSASANHYLYLPFVIRGIH